MSTDHQVTDDVVAEVKAILDLSRVSPDDDFFSLGGDSLDAVELGTRLSKRFGVTVGSDDVYLAQSLSELAAKVTERLPG